MTDKKLTATFEYCVTQDNCNYCPMSGNCPTNFELQKQALDLIKRQQAEIERLKQERDEEHDSCNHYMRMCAKAHIEGAKEFAERLKGAFCPMCEYDGGDIKDAIDNTAKEMG